MDRRDDGQFGLCPAIRAFGFAPAIEYNWRADLGLLAGVRIFTDGHNSMTTVAPLVALNYVH